MKFLLLTCDQSLILSSFMYILFLRNALISPLDAKKLRFIFVLHSFMQISRSSSAGFKGSYDKPSPIKILNIHVFNVRSMPYINNIYIWRIYYVIICIKLTFLFIRNCFNI